MKFFTFATIFALIAIIAADVSHLPRSYLPPTQTYTPPSNEYLPPGQQQTYNAPAITYTAPASVQTSFYQSTPAAPTVSYSSVDSRFTVPAVQPLANEYLPPVQQTYTAPQSYASVQQTYSAPEVQYFAPTLQYSQPAVSQSSYSAPAVQETNSAPDTSSSVDAVDTPYAANGGYVYKTK